LKDSGEFADKNEVIAPITVKIETDRGLSIDLNGLKAWVAILFLFTPGHRLP
jgi:hypothetical protein